jgi:type II secretory ATPase GspE/PulE/Tfp pilus assembly ATPase PilB-like protein
MNNQNYNPSSQNQQSPQQGQVPAIQNTNQKPPVPTAPTLESPPAPPVQQTPQPAALSTQPQPKALPKEDPLSENPKFNDLKRSILSNNVPQIVLLIISLALDLRSSDIHIEPLEELVRVRFRVDGVLQKIVEYPMNVHPAVVSRVKIMSSLKIDESRIPQDGRTNVTTQDGREMDLRVSTFPTVNSEKIVMRIQDKSREIPQLEKLGITGNSLKFLNRALKMPNGIILTSGPTGSGKTTTLYACLTKLNKIGVNILTIEDPVEIQLDGLNQSQVKSDIGYKFSTGLRSALRQDPDIMMVGEIRDKETINVAIESALTGHLVFSTIHTNSAVETLTRILNMEVPAYLIASTVDTIIAQRLVRLLDPEIRVVDNPSPDVLEAAKKAIETMPESEKSNYPNIDFENPVFYRPDPRLPEGKGYKGRVGLYEIMSFNQRLKNAVLQGKNTLEIQAIAQEEGMVTLEQSGVIRALEGKTSLSEVYRVANQSD